jgi:hypothetical protein
MAAKRMAKGYKSQLWLGFESEYGVMPASPKNYSLPFNSYGVTLSRTLTQAETISGTRNPLEPFSGNTDVSGDIVVPLDLSAYGYWLRALLGKPTTVVTRTPSKFRTTSNRSGFRRSTRPIRPATFFLPA